MLVFRIILSFFCTNYLVYDRRCWFPSSTVCWLIVNSLWKPLETAKIGNDRVFKLLTNGRCIDSIWAGFWAAQCWTIVGHLLTIGLLANGTQGEHFLLWATISQRWLKYFVLLGFFKYLDTEIHSTPYKVLGSFLLLFYYIALLVFVSWLI